MFVDMAKRKPKVAKPEARRCKGSKARPHCRNKVAVRKSGPRKGKAKGALCHACRMATWRVNSPYRAAYLRLKGHAAEREIEFRVSFAHFCSIARKSELIGNQGLTATALTIDRRDNLKGYVIGNLKVMTRSANTIKRNKADAIRYRCGYAWNGGHAPGDEPDDLPENQNPKHATCQDHQS